MEGAVDADDGGKTLRERQTDAVLDMLHFNLPWTRPNADATGAAAAYDDVDAAGTSTVDGDGNAETWKVLVYDLFGRDVISPLLRVGDLREQAVTLHMLLHSDRQPVPDVSAIYFVEPKQDNIDRIAKDLAANLYESYYINFLAPVPGALLNQLAAASVQADVVDRVAKVYDQYLNFISLEPRLFSLRQPEAFVTLNSISSAESEVTQTTEAIASGLLSVLVTLGSPPGDVPIIRAPRGNAAGMVAEKLEQSLRNHLSNSRGNLFPDTAGVIGYQRPVLILLDRATDLPSAFQHPWTYQALVHDILDLRLNRITVEMPDGAGTKRKDYDLDMKDNFWRSNVGTIFPEVAEHVETDLAKYKEEHDRVTRITGQLSSDDLMREPRASDTADLRSAVAALPILHERKRVLDMHMNIATALLRAIKERHLDEFHGIESTISRQTPATILALLNDPTKGTADDKMRLFLVYYLSASEVAENDVAAMEAALVASKCNMAAVAYAKRFKSVAQMHASSAGSSSATGQRPAQSLSSSTADLLGGFGIKLLDNLKSALSADQQPPVLAVVSALMENRASPETDDYVYLDPRSAKRADLRQAPGAQARRPFQSAIVFVVGGGTYVEHLQLQQYARAQLVPKTITYGATDLVNPRLLLRQVEHLGKT